MPTLTKSETQTAKQAMKDNLFEKFSDAKAAIVEARKEGWTDKEIADTERDCAEMIADLLKAE